MSAPTEPTIASQEFADRCGEPRGSTQQGLDNRIPCARGQFIECKDAIMPGQPTLSASDRTVATTTIAIRAALDRQTTRATTNRQGHNK